MSEPTATVLIVDDAYLVRWVLHNRLIAEGFHVLEANSVSDALAPERLAPADCSTNH